MKELILLFGIPSGVVILMHELTFFGYRIYPPIVKLLNFKPFTCELCLSFWTHFGIVSYLNGFDIYGVTSSLLAGVIGYLISLKFIKF
jgi:hypothetical protein